MRSDERDRLASRSLGVTGDAYLHRRDAPRRDRETHSPAELKAAFDGIVGSIAAGDFEMADAAPPIQ